MRWLQALSVLAAMLCTVTAGTYLSAADLARPNIILIISDDHAWTDYGFMGNQTVRTPNLDRLAAEGLTFTRGYVTTALCSPSLATLLTGLYPHQHGITGNDPVAGQPREAWLENFFRHPMLPRLLAEAGYLSLHTGKFWMRRPADVGFTHDMGATDRHGGQALAIGRQTMQPIYDFIQTALVAEKPFFIWYAPFLPHLPHNPPERLVAKYSHVADPNEAKYFAMIEWLDETCGDLMAYLKSQSIDDKTLVVFLADNGWHAFGKSSPYENGVRTPIIVRWPGQITPRLDTQHLASNIDILPTILAAAGVAQPDGLPGINLLDEGAVSARDTLFFANFSHDMVSPDRPAASLWTRSCIHGHWKLVSWQSDPPQAKPSLGGETHKDPSAMVELFDLSNDPQETKNVAAQHPQRVEQLQEKLDSWWKPE